MTALVRLPATGVSSLFSALARLRRAPGVHPQRVGFAGHLVVDTANALLPEGDHEAHARAHLAIIRLLPGRP